MLYVKGEKKTWGDCRYGFIVNQITLIPGVLHKFQAHMYVKAWDQHSSSE